MNRNPRTAGDRVHKPTQFQVADYLFSIAEHLPYHIYLKDRDRRFLWANEAMIRACGFSELYYLLGLRDEDLFADPHLSEARDDDLKVINDGKLIAEKLEFETWKQPGGGSQSNPEELSRLSLVVTTKRRTFEAGKVTGLIGITRDYGLELPDFIKNGSNSWALNSFSSGVYYSKSKVMQSVGAGKNTFKTETTWADRRFKELFPGNALQGRWNQLVREDRHRVMHFLQRLRRPPEGRMNATITASIDFRASVHNKQRWIRGTGIAFGTDTERTLICAHQDVSEETQAEALSARALLSLPNDTFVFVKDPEKRFCFMNTAFLRALGLRLRDVLNKTDEELGFPPDQISVFSKYDDAILSGESKGPVTSVGEQVTNSEGKTLTLITLKMPIQSDIFDPGWKAVSQPKSFHVLGIAWDMSRYAPKERDAIIIDQTARSAWLGLLDHSTEAVFLKTVTGVYMTVSEAFAQRLGRPRQAFVGHTTREVFADRPDLLNSLLEEDSKLIAQNMRRIETIRQVPGPHGESRAESCEKIAIPDATGVVGFILGICRDIPQQDYGPEI